MEKIVKKENFSSWFLFSFMKVQQQQVSIRSCYPEDLKDAELIKENLKVLFPCLHHQSQSISLQALKDFKWHTIWEGTWNKALKKKASVVLKTEIG